VDRGCPAAGLLDVVRATVPLGDGRAGCDEELYRVGEEHVALMVREKLGDTDNRLDVFRVNVYRVRNGKIVEIRIFEGDQYAMDEYTSDITSG
jgi:hypothetical protein